MKTLREVVTTDAIYMDAKQKRGLEKLDQHPPPGFVTNTNLPCADWAWLQDGKLVAIEEKFSSDLDQSLRARRLQRQFRQMLDQADICLLGLRTESSSFINPAQMYEFAHYTPRHFKRGMSPAAAMLELAKWNNIGGTVFIPHREVYQYMKELRGIIGTQKDNLSILAGNDKTRPKASTPFQRGLKRLFDGVGQGTAEKIESGFIAADTTDLAQAMVQNEKAWRAAGAHKGIIKQLQEYRN